MTSAALLLQELKPKSLDVRQEELGAMVDKELAATSSAIEEAVRRIEVRAVRFLQEPWGWVGRVQAAPALQRTGGLCRSGPEAALTRALTPPSPPWLRGRCWGGWSSARGPLLPARSRLSLVQDMMAQARHASSGVKLEVNER